MDLHRYNHEYQEAIHKAYSTQLDQSDLHLLLQIMQLTLQDVSFLTYIFYY